MRKDSFGLFWQDEAPVKWSLPASIAFSDSSETVAEIESFAPELFSDSELLDYVRSRKPLFLDVEIYENYFLVSFLAADSQKCVVFEAHDGKPLDIVEMSKLDWIMRNALTVGFNSLNFDNYIIQFATVGKRTDELKSIADQIIVDGIKGWQLLRANRIKRVDYNHIDLIEVAPLSGSLKIYAARAGAKRIQDLPIKPDARLSEYQKKAILRYNIDSDLVATRLLYETLRAQIKLREDMSREYEIDLRSKSDAQIAEAVIKRRLSDVGINTQSLAIENPAAFRYQVPEFVQFQSDRFKGFLELVRRQVFHCRASGHVVMPEAITSYDLSMAGKSYSPGIGGLHSNESNSYSIADDEYAISDFDVTSYYPSIILNQRLFPSQLTERFLSVYQDIVNDRIEAKHSGNKVVADSLKIVINGSFGKFGSMFSILYSPQLLVQVTLTGQLALLMLIEAASISGISVLSANTDGVVFRYKRAERHILDSIVRWWQATTKFELEESKYVGLYSLNVNNYFAITESGKIKEKGIFGQQKGVDALKKNPHARIVAKAVIDFVSRGTSIEDTIGAATDILDFAIVRTIKGGGVLVDRSGTGAFAAKTARWYWATDCSNHILYAGSGNRVSFAENVRLINDLPASFPADVDKYRYIAEAYELLKSIKTNNVV